MKDKMMNDKWLNFNWYEVAITAWGMFWWAIGSYHAEFVKLTLIGILSVCIVITIFALSGIAGTLFLRITARKPNESVKGVTIEAK